MKTISLGFSFLLTILMSYAQNVEVITDNAQKSSFEQKSYLVVKSLVLKPGFVVTGASGGFYAKKHTMAELTTIPSLGQNFTGEDLIAVGGITNPLSVDALTEDERSTTFQYFDGFGRPTQLVHSKGSPELKDFVQPFYYDAEGRPSRIYLPYSDAFGINGEFRNDGISRQLSFFSTPPEKIQADSRPFSESTYEKSPFNALEHKKAFGAEWNEKETFFGSKLNDGGSIPYWEIINDLPRSATNWPEGTLVVDELKNEENVTARSYTDAQGRIVLKEELQGGSSWIRTYYVYDDYGHVLFVIPASIAQNLAPTQSQVDTWCFQYKYDDKQRLIGVKPPGAGWVLTIYDQWDRRVLTQDPVQRGKVPGEWTFTKYDDLNRPIMTGVYESTASAATLQSAVASSSVRHENRNTSVDGYTLNLSFPTTATDQDLLSITYYDDYNFLTNVSWDAENNSYAFVSENGYTGTPLTSAKGLVTGGKLKVLGSNQWLNSVNYYDDRYHTIQVLAEHHLGKINRKTFGYDFLGHVEKVRLFHNAASGANVIVSQRFSYDHAKRLAQAWHKVNDDKEILMVAYEYNELGQVTKKQLHESAGAWLQAVDYRYNVNGWLTQINYTDPEPGDAIDYFNLKLGYQDSEETANQPRFDGLITSFKWKDGEQSQAYNLYYDNRGQLTSSVYRQKVEEGWTSSPGAYDEAVEYNGNGNITSLNRRGTQAASAAEIDNLTYVYDGNQLSQVDDTAPTGAKDEGFKDGNTSGSDYTYDANGSLIIDKNRGVTQITYNSLNLVQHIAFDNGSYLQYLYDAKGKKLRQTFYEAASQKTEIRDYVDDLVYQNGDLLMILTPEGSYQPGSKSYYYYLIDNLGSTRVVLRTENATNVDMATLEKSEMTAGENSFLRYENVRRIQSSLFDKTNGASVGYAARLNGTDNEKFGLAKSLSVMPGDVIRMGVFAKYVDPDRNNWKNALPTIMDLITAPIAAAAVVDGVGYSNSTSTFQYGGLLNKSGESVNTAPKAYLNYILFDRNFNFKDGGFVRVSELAKENGMDIPHEQLTKELTIKEAGYIYAFLSNENETPIDVFFDDFTVEQIESPVTQINGYYPYGLPMYSWLRENEREVREKFQGKEYERLTGTYDFHARQYDAALGRFLGIDPQGQFASPYTAMGNNPILMVDPDGEFAFVPVMVGAVVGAYMGGTMANAGEMNPGKWDYNSGRTWSYMGAGALVGGLSGGLAHGVATSGIPFANTAAIMTGSAFNSFGTYIYTSGQTDLSIAFGVASYNFTQNEWGYLGKKGNSVLANVGYGLGALANISDVLIGFKPNDVQLNTEKSDAIGHSALTKVGETDPHNSLVSVGPDPGGKWIFNPFKFKKGTNDWKNYVDAGSDVSKVTVKGVNVSRIANYGAKLNGGVKYNLYFSSCVNHTARALTISGVPTLGIHPFVLHAQMFLRSVGFRPIYYSYSPYLIQNSND